MRKIVSTTIVLTLLATPLLAQDQTFGEMAFQDRCSVCHGESGAGDGAVGELFSQRPGNLQRLAAENGGDFPWERVIASIDGSTGIAAHGSSEMPIWGEYLMVEALQERDIDPAQAREMVDGRILSLAFYISTLQSE